MNIVEKDVDKAVDKGRALAEWHDMTPGQQQVAWAELRAWVAWLYDRYELGTEDRLPRCWPRHPGLVEELWALRAWRLEVYSGGQPSGQAARYWHTELRQPLSRCTLPGAGPGTGARPRWWPTTRSLPRSGHAAIRSRGRRGSTSPPAGRAWRGVPHHRYGRGGPRLWRRVAGAAATGLRLLRGGMVGAGVLGLGQGPPTRRGR
jgi:hypothetical protein